MGAFISYFMSFSFLRGMFMVTFEKSASIIIIQIFLSFLTHGFERNQVHLLRFQRVNRALKYGFNCFPYKSVQSDFQNHASKISAIIIFISLN